MRLTKTTSHAIRILIECAEAGGQLVTTASIARTLDLTPLHVLKIVNFLSAAGIVECVRGRKGGVRLAKPAVAIRIGDIVRTIESTKFEIAGTERGPDSSEMLLEAIFDDALEAFVGVLDQHTLADMTQGGSRAFDRPTIHELSARLAKLTSLQEG